MPWPVERTRRCRFPERGESYLATVASFTEGVKLRRREFIHIAFAVASGTACGVAPDWQDDTDARWDAFRERLRNRHREIAEDGHEVLGCHIRPEGRDGLRHVHVLLKNEEPIEFFL